MLLMERCEVKKINIIILVALVLLVFSSVVYAATMTKRVPIKIEIVPGDKILSVFVGENATAPTDEIDIQTFKRGTSITLPVLARNTGTETLINETVSVVPSTFSWGTITLSKTTLGTLSANQTVSFNLTIAVPANATTGNFTGVSLEFDEP